MILVSCMNIIFMHIQKDINLGLDLIKTNFGEAGLLK